MHVTINKVSGEIIYYTSSFGETSWEGILTRIKNQR